MRILHVCPRETFSGLESWVLEMLQFQRAQGVDARLIALANSPLAEKAAAVGVPVFFLERSLANTVSKCGFAFDILHCHGTQEFKSLALWIAWRKGVGRARFRVVLQLHIWISHRKRDPLHWVAYSLLDEIWCSSTRAREAVLENFPVAADRVRVVFYGRDIAKIKEGLLLKAEARAALKLPAHATIYGTVSRLDRGKGIGELLRGGLTCLDSDPDLHVAIIGFATHDRDAVRFNQEIKEFLEGLPAKVRAKIHFLGSIPDSYRYLRAFDLFTLLTYRECFSLALIEAQAAELPCLVTNAGGSPELVREGETGWLCEPQSDTSFGDALGRALGESARWSEYGRRACARVEREFNSARVLESTLAVYQELIRESPPAEVGSRLP